MAAYEKTELIPEEIELLKRNLEKNICVGCWLKNEKAIADKIKKQNDLIEVTILKLENLKKCFIGSDDAIMKPISFEAYIQEIIDSLNGI